MSNPGRYLAPAAADQRRQRHLRHALFPGGSGLPFKGYDFQLSFDYMPSQWVTWKVEFTQRGAQQPIFAGPWRHDASRRQQRLPAVLRLQRRHFVGLRDARKGLCGGDGGVWYPDLVKQERRWIFALMVKL